MKKLKKLSLNKEKITSLEKEEMNSLNGGAFDSHVCGTYFKTGACYGAGHTTAGTIWCGDASTYSC